MTLDWIYDLWISHVDFALWQMFLIGLFFIIVFSGLFGILLYVRREHIILVGYPKLKGKKKEKLLKNRTWLDRLFLIDLVNGASVSAGILYISLICHWICLCAMLISIVGFIASLITLADGWSMTLLLIVPAIAFFSTIAIEVIPILIWIPSERQRWKK